MHGKLHMENAWKTKTHGKLHMENAWKTTHLPFFTCTAAKMAQTPVPECAEASFPEWLSPHFQATCCRRSAATY